MVASMGQQQLAYATDTRGGWQTVGMSSFDSSGVMDLSALANNSAGSSGGSGAAEAGAFVVEVTTENFQTEVLQRSMTVPVVVDFWADWCGPCKQLSPVLHKLAQEYGGRFVLATIDVDANQEIAQSAQVQSIPTVLGILKGQAVPLFQSALPEADVRAYLDELLKVASANGVTGQVDGATSQTATDEAAAEPATDPRFDAAYDAIEKGDLDGAAAAYQAVLDESPTDTDARAGLAQVNLMRRVTNVDPARAAAATEAAPDDVDAATLSADLSIANGDPAAAFDRLIQAVRVTSDDERERARAHLLELFELVGSSDPRVAQARTALANALF